ncbi:hypothetical protein RJ639_047355 [Escallonia herrerae]|uniref:Uncharacterized protein n=1 Tax=Escallonia herrerae TaxID=1293975 RepID=A0AA89B5K5_9ASTE|nr:hypothetical protein RJ639_047355 [Escallonia herrerae]
MKEGRKNLKRAAEEASFDLQQGQSIMQVISHRGSNLIEDENELNSSNDDDDDGFLPLEANTNRMKPGELQANRESDSDTDS